VVVEVVQDFVVVEVTGGAVVGATAEVVVEVIQHQKSQ